MSDSESDTGHLIANLVKKYSPHTQEFEEGIDVLDIPTKEEEFVQDQNRKRKPSKKVAEHLEKTRPIAVQKRKEYAAQRREIAKKEAQMKYLDDLKNVALEEMQQVKKEKKQVKMVRDLEALKIELEQKKEQEEKWKEEEEEEEEEEFLPKKTVRKKTPIPRRGIEKKKKDLVVVKVLPRKKVQKIEYYTESDTESEPEVVRMPRKKAVVKKGKQGNVEREDFSYDDGYYF